MAGTDSRSSPVPGNLRFARGPCDALGIVVTKGEACSSLQGESVPRAVKHVMRVTVVNCMEELKQILRAPDKTGTLAKGASRVHGDCEESSTVTRWPEIVSILRGHRVRFPFVNLKGDPAGCPVGPRFSRDRSDLNEDGVSSVDSDIRSAAGAVVCGHGCVNIIPVT